MSQMLLWMSAQAIAREVKNCCRRIFAAKRPIVAHVGPQPGQFRLDLGKQRNGSIVPVNALASKDVGLEQMVEWLQNRRALANIIGQRRKRQVDAFSGVLVALPVERLVESKFGIQDHG